MNGRPEVMSLQFDGRTRTLTIKGPLGWVTLLQRADAIAKLHVLFRLLGYERPSVQIVYDGERKLRKNSREKFLLERRSRQNMGWKRVRAWKDPR